MEELYSFIMEHRFLMLIPVCLNLVLLFLIFRKTICGKIKQLAKFLATKCKSVFYYLKPRLVSIKHRFFSIINRCINRIKIRLKKNKGQIIFLIFYLLYISFFVFLVINERMQEADVAFKYIVFPLYFALPILFKSAFEKIEELTYKLEEQTGTKHVRKKGSGFATDDDIKGATKLVDLSKDVYNNSGIPIIYDGGLNAFVEDSESHSLIIGSTGCGKTRRLVLPLINIIAKKSESFIATDPKGELYSSTRDTLEKKGYKIIVLNFRNPQFSNSWNPLHLPYMYFMNGNKDKSIELLNDLGLSIFVTSKTNTDPFWENSAIDYFIGLAIALFEDADDEQEINFNSIYTMSIDGERKIGPKRLIENYFDWRDENSIASMSASGTVYAPTDTRGSILSVFRQKIRIFNANRKLSQMMSFSDFDISDIVKDKTAIFIIIHDEKSTYHPLASAFIKQTYEELVDVANSYTNGKLPLRVNYILDEFANLPKIVDMENIITASRSRNIRLYLIIQGIKQLNSVYGDDVAEIIKGNCDYWYYMISKELSLLKEISELCGIKQNDEDFFNSNSPLVSITDLQLLQLGEVLVLQKRLPPYMAKMLDIDKYIHFSNNEEHIEPPGNIKPDSKVFSMKKYVAKNLLRTMFMDGLFDQATWEILKDAEFDEINEAIEKKIKEMEEENEHEQKQKEFQETSDNKKTEL